MAVERKMEQKLIGLGLYLVIVDSGLLGPTSFTGSFMGLMDQFNTSFFRISPKKYQLLIGLKYMWEILRQRNPIPN
jgi:hypothetical protein